MFLETIFRRITNSPEKQPVFKQELSRFRVTTVFEAREL